MYIRCNCRAFCYFVFQMEAKPEDYVTEESEDGMDSDDPLTATDTKYGKSFRSAYNFILKNIDLIYKYA